ncbi:glycosyltransferase family 117 protein [Sphingobacterium cellulitidis]|uniref:glycosyltransferase family 117 protein n=1 Tax=Sphingobacterium cellulitidis TaxID=1768011 RepID=UPI000B93B09C|nr:multidrug transporter [Sphingobacterium cellulitidis]
MNYNKINNLLGWLCGFIAFLVYFMTVDQTTSWWDTGEFIAASDKLEIVHQPGAPLFLLIQNIFSNLAFGNKEMVAYWMNIGAAICSALTIVFLFWTITALARKLLIGKNEGNKLQFIQIFAAGIVGSLAYSFTDSFWYSAVESEVYAMSSLCTAIVFWLALKWERRADEPDSNKWLLLIAYVMGLSIGVHLLNLLTIPALALLVYFRKSKQVTWGGAAKTLGWGVLILAFILWGVIQYSVKIASQFDLFFVNSLGLPFGSGITFFVLLLVTGAVFGIVYSIKRNKPILNLIILGTCLVFFGFTSFSMLLIRSQTNITLNNNDPDNVFSFLGYLSREQYQSEPLFKGPNFNSQITDVKASVGYRKDETKYSKFENFKGYEYDKEVLFPRLYSSKHAAFYKQYLHLADGEDPTFLDNMKFFFNYQVGHMYSRYFMWNFVGRQNDVPSQGELTAGNWISGINFLDELRLPGVNSISDSMRKDPSRNTYFFLPLLLGIAGLIWQAKRNQQDATIVGLLFFFTGLAIVLYLNQTPLQPRERDYSYAGSFYVFAIWIGLGVLGIIDFLNKRSKASIKVITYSSVAFSMLAGPVLLIKENWNDHDRSGRRMSREVALNTLNSCEPNAILFTYADNDTFPLWYLQEVEGVRTDVRVLNYGYLASDWYVKQALEDVNQSKALPIAFDFDKVKKGVRDVIQVVDLGIEGYSDVEELLAVMLSDDNKNKLQTNSGEFINVMPNKKLQLKINKQKALENANIPAEWQEYIPEYMQWELKDNMVTRADLSLMSILVNNEWKRPVYFVSISAPIISMGMEKYLASEGLVSKLMPVDMGQSSNGSGLINAEKIYDNAINKFQWSNINSLEHFDVDSNQYYENWVFPNVYTDGMQTLLNQGKMKEAKELALQAYDFQPKETKSMRQAYYNSVLLDTLVKVKEVDRAKLLAGKQLKAIQENLDYQLAIYEKVSSGYNQIAIQLGLYALDQYVPILKELGDEKLLAEASRMDKKYKSIWMKS